MEETLEAQIKLAKEQLKDQLDYLAQGPKGKYWAKGNFVIFYGEDVKGWRLWGLWYAPYFLGFSVDSKHFKT